VVTPAEFLEHVRVTDTCWFWTGKTWPVTGYGRLGRQRAHRLAYELFVGPIPNGRGFHGTCVCHTCDVRLCVNPAHLWLGTNGDNLRDMRDKGRLVAPRGAAHPRAKLTDDRVREIRKLREAGLSLEALRERFGVTTSVLSGICRRTRWAHVS